MNPSRIIVRGPNWVGDCVLSVPAMKAVRTLFPDSEITLLIRPWVAGLFSSAPFIDDVWTHSKPGSTAWIRTAREIRRRRFDMALLLPNSFESALTVFLGGVPERVGYGTDGRGFLLTRSVPLPSHKHHQVHYYLGLVEQLFGTIPEPSISIRATEEERVGAQRLLQTNGIDPDADILIINPGAAYGSAKRWSEERFAKVADMLSEERQAQVVIIGSADERVIGERVQSLMERPGTVLSGQTSLEILIGLLSEAALVVTNDSGPMHIAAALGTPTVAVFGSTDDAVTRPVGPTTSVVRHDVECSPCLLRECPIDHRCMDGVTVEAVFHAAMSIGQQPGADLGSRRTERA